MMHERPWGERHRILGAVFPFTMVELLVVIAIIIVLLSLLLPSLSKAKMAVKRTACASNQRQIASCVLMYYSDYNALMPGQSTTGTDWGWVRWRGNPYNFYCYFGLLHSLKYTPKDSILTCPTQTPNWMYSSYTYRNGAKWNGEIGFKLNDAISKKCLGADRFQYADVDSMHKDGYSRVFFDGHVKYYPDPTHFIKFCGTNYNNTLYKVWTAFDASP